MTSSRRRRTAFAGFALFALFALAAGSAHAQQRTAADLASARQLYNEGIELRDKGDMKGALEKFKAAHALGNTPVTGLELCRAHSAMKQPVEAREVCLAVGRIPPLAEETQRSKDARSDAARLAEAEKPKIGALKLKITGVPAGWQPTVTVDGAAVPAPALGEPRAVNPGVHTIVAKVGSGPETRATLETKDGESRELELAVQPPPQGETPGAAPVGPSPGPTPAPAQPAQEKKNPLATASFAVAGIAGGIGAVAGLVAMSNESDLEESCARKVCGPDQHDKLDSARSWGTVSSVFFVVGGIALGTGLVASLTGGSSKSAKSGVRVTPVVGAGGAGLHGSF